MEAWKQDASQAGAQGIGLPAWPSDGEHQALLCSAALPGKELMIQTMALPWHHQGLQGSPSTAPPAEKAKHSGGKAEHTFHSQPAAGTGVLRAKPGLAGVSAPTGTWSMQQLGCDVQRDMCHRWQFGGGAAKSAGEHMAGALPAPATSGNSSNREWVMGTEPPSLALLRSA